MGELVQDAPAVLEALVAYRRAIDDCLALLHAVGEAIAPRSLVAPKPMIATATGEVTLRWTLSDCRLDMVFEGDGQYSAYAYYPNGHTYGSKGRVRTQLPEALQAALLRAG